MPRLRHKRQMLPNLPARLRAFGARAGALTAPPLAPPPDRTHIWWLWASSGSIPKRRPNGWQRRAAVIIFADVLQVTAAGKLHRLCWPGSENIVPDALNPSRKRRLTAARYSPA